MARPAQNSTEIVRRHAATYKEVFASCEVVTSAPGVFFWAGEHVVVDGSLAICQQIPLRVYVGLRRRLLSTAPGLPLSFSDEASRHLVYDSRFDRFVPLQVRAVEEASAIESTFGEIVKDLVAYLDGELTGHFEISTLHELKPGAGANWSGAFSCALASALLMVTGRLSSADMASWRAQSASRLGMPGSSFDQVHRLGWIVDSAFHRGAASGYGTFVSILPGDQPILYAADPRGPGEAVPFFLSGADPALQRHAYDGVRLSDIQEGAKGQLLPRRLQCGLIYTGRPKETADSVAHARAGLASIDAIGGSVDTLLSRAGAFSRLHSNPAQLLLERSARSGQSRAGLWAGLVTDGLSVGSLRVLAAMEPLWTAPGVSDTSGTVAALARAIRAADGGLAVLGLDWYEGRILSAEVYRRARGRGFYDEVATKPTGGARGGQLLYVGPFNHQFVLEICELCDVAADDFGLPVSLDWSSQLDGLESDGLRIEFSARQEVTAPRIGVVPDRRRDVAMREFGDRMATFRRLTVGELDELRRQAVLFISENALDRVWVRGTELRMRGHFGAFMLGRAAAVSEGARYFESLIIFARLRAEKAPARFQVDRFRADVVKPVNDLLIRETANLRCRVWSAPALRRDQEELLEFGYDVRDLPGDFKLGLDWSQATTGAMVAVDGPSGFGIG